MQFRNNETWHLCVRVHIESLFPKALNLLQPAAPQEQQKDFKEERAKPNLQNSKGLRPLGINVWDLKIFGS